MKIKKQAALSYPDLEEHEEVSFSIDQILPGIHLAGPGTIMPLLPDLLSIYLRSY